MPYSKIVLNTKDSSMKALFWIGITLNLFCSVAFADDDKTRKASTLVNGASFDPEAAQQLAKQCDAIFEARKQEIATSLLQLQQQQSTLQILTTENTRLLKEKEEQMKLKENALKKMYADMKDEEAKKSAESEAKLDEAKKLLKENEEILKQITGAKDTKLAESYAKMKDSKAAPILAAMPEDDAVMILLSLKPNQMGSILAQMQPDKAAELTKLIKYFPSKKPVPQNIPTPTASPDGINVENNMPQNTNETSGNTQNALPQSFQGGTRVY